MLFCHQGAAAGAETTDIKQRMLEAGRFSAVAYRDLLCQVSSVRRSYLKKGPKIMVIYFVIKHVVMFELTVE